MTPIARRPKDARRWCGGRAPHPHRPVWRLAKCWAASLGDTNPVREFVCAACGRIVARWIRGELAHAQPELGSTTPLQADRLPPGGAPR